METAKTIEMKCGQAYVIRLDDGNLLELGDVFLPNENEKGTRPYRCKDFGIVSDANKRVMTICTMAGCCGSCVFCSVRRSFKRLLTRQELVGQVDFLLEQGEQYGRAPSPLQSKEFHVLYTRMGEPSLNMQNVIGSIYDLKARYPHIRVGLSTVGWKVGMKKLLEHREIAPHIMLQFSMHSTDEAVRARLLGLPSNDRAMNFSEMSEFVRAFRRHNARMVSLNFILLRGMRQDFQGLRKYFSPEDVYIRLSPLNVTENSDREELAGLLREEDVLHKAPISSAELADIMQDLDDNGFAYAYAPAIDEEIRNRAACGQALETLKKSTQAADFCRRAA